MRLLIRARPETFNYTVLIILKVELFSHLSGQLMDERLCSTKFQLNLVESSAWDRRADRFKKKTNICYTNFSSRNDIYCCCKAVITLEHLNLRTSYQGSSHETHLS